MLVNTTNIVDKFGTLLAMHIRYDIDKPSNHLSQEFPTPTNTDQQVALMNLPKGHKIQAHCHILQYRKLETTSETLIILEGDLQFSIYDQDQHHVYTSIASKGSILVLLKGGHSFQSLSNVKLIESKQGPYLSRLDKTLF